ncbi:MAG: alpha-ketoglutarate-dependent dioxygenase AlkB [Massilia sp.]
MDLFNSSTSLPATLESIAIEDGELGWLAQLPLAESNEAVLARLIAETDWKSETITLWGKPFAQPRLTAWHGDKGYRYSGLTLDPLPFTPLLQTLKAAVEAVSGARFNSVLLNYYRDGRDSMGMHSDDEAELGPAPVIASLSFGATRQFILQHKRTRERLKLPLTTGSLLLMGGNMQKNWLHGINKVGGMVGPRVSLTFRFIY